MMSPVIGIQAFLARRRHRAGERGSSCISERQLLRTIIDGMGVYGTIKVRSTSGWESSQEPEPAPLGRKNWLAPNKSRLPTAP
jgi:hypothetical protein